MTLKINGSSSQGNNYVIQNDTEALLIEAGCPLIKATEAAQFQLNKIKGCIISHEHGDHAGHAKEYAEQGIPIYALRSVFKRYDITKNNNIIEERRAFQIGGFDIVPLAVQHDVPCVGFIIKHKECGKIVFFTDTFAFPYNIKGVTTWLAEANYSDDILNKNIKEGAIPYFLRNRLLTSHMEIKNTIRIFQRSDLSDTRNIILIHLSAGNSDENSFIKQVQRATGKKTIAAKTGTTININKNII